MEEKILTRELSNNSKVYKRPRKTTNYIIMNTNLNQLIEEQEELNRMATLYDSLSPTLKQIFVSQIGYGETIQNTSNASSHIDVLKEENNEMCSIHSVDMTGKCFKCGLEPFGHFEMCENCLGFNHSCNGNF